MKLKNSYIMLILIVLIAIVAVFFALYGLGTGGIIPSSGNPVTNGASGIQNGFYRTVTDMAGRQVTIPANVTRVIGSPGFVVYFIAPDKLAGWDSTLTNETQEYYSKLPANITVLSGSRGGGNAGSGGNYEAQIALHPDLVFISCGDGNAIRYDAVNMTQEKYGSIPVVCLNNTQNVTNAVPVFQFMGDVLGEPDRADQLIGYYNDVSGEVQDKISQIPVENRTRVYYAEGTDGLATDGSGSIHSQLIDFCGGDNVATIQGLQSGSGMTAVTMESVLIWNPDVIITTSSAFANNVYNDSTWEKIPAVQNHRIYVTPSEPQNWFDRSPSFMRIVGIPWTAHALYPDLFPDDWLKEKVKEFFSVYYGMNLTDSDYNSLISPGI